jgi:hypothetical protein
MDLAVEQQCCMDWLHLPLFDNMWPHLKEGMGCLRN